MKSSRSENFNFVRNHGKISPDRDTILVLDKQSKEAQMHFSARVQIFGRLKTHLELRIAKFVVVCHQTHSYSKFHLKFLRVEHRIHITICRLWSTINSKFRNQIVLNRTGRFSGRGTTRAKGGRGPPTFFNFFPISNIPWFYMLFQ